MKEECANTYYMRKAHGPHGGGSSMLEEASVRTSRADASSASRNAWSRLSKRKRKRKQRNEYSKKMNFWSCGRQARTRRRQLQEEIAYLSSTLSTTAPMIVVRCLAPYFDEADSDSAKDSLAKPPGSTAACRVRRSRKR